MIENLFLALNISNQFSDFLTEKINLLREKTDAFRWERKEKYHITIRYFGVVNPSEIGKLKSAIELLDDFPKIVLNLSGFSAFIVKLRPTILYAHFKRNAVLEKFANGIIHNTNNIGNVRSAAVFTPHLTIGRAKEKPEKEFMDFYSMFNPGAFDETIESMSIYKSIQHAKGLDYKEIKKYNF